MSPPHLLFKLKITDISENSTTYNPYKKTPRVRAGVRTPGNNSGQAEPQSCVRRVDWLTDLPDGDLENSVIIPCTDAISVRLTPNPQLSLHYLDFICPKEGTRLPRPGLRVYQTERGYRATRPLKMMRVANKDGPIQLYLVQASPWTGFQICTSDDQVIKEIGVSITIEPKEPGPDGPARPWLGELW